MSDLLNLADRCERARGPDRTIEQDIHDAVFGTGYLENQFQTDGSRIKPYTASVDAAMTLVAEGWGLTLDVAKPRSSAQLFGDDPIAVGTGASAALAIRAAALRASAGKSA